MQPRSDGAQRCVRFGLSTTPPSRVMMYQDHDGNIVHHFNIPGRHSRLTVTAEALVECRPPAPLSRRPRASTRGTASTAPTPSGEFWDVLNPSPFARPTPLLDELALARDRPRARRRSAVHRAAARLARRSHALRVQPEEHARRFADRRCAAARRGVCQDFAHIMIALVRRLGIPCRYVSGYLFQEHDGTAPVGRRRDARVGRGVAAGPRLGGLRSDEQHRSPANGTSASRSAATTPTCRRRAASSRGRAR